MGCFRSFAIEGSGGCLESAHIAFLHSHIYVAPASPDHHRPLPDTYPNVFALGNAIECESRCSNLQMSV